MEMSLEFMKFNRPAKSLKMTSNSKHRTNKTDTERRIEKVQKADLRKSVFYKIMTTHQ